MRNGFDEEWLNYHNYTEMNGVLYNHKQMGEYYISEIAFKWHHKLYYKIKNILP